MKPYYEDGGLHLWHGSNKTILPTFPDDTFDSIVTDPPYELGFMGKGWDSSGIAYDVDMWAECLRVLKPGGHLLAFGGTRTWHRMTVAIEDAGFEIRDSIAWLYGSGFPKSLDVAKAIDKRPGVARHAEFAAHLAERRKAVGLSRADVSERIVGTRTGACWNWEHHQFPEAKWWARLQSLLDLDAMWGEVVAEAERERVGAHKAGLKTGAAGVGGGGAGGYITTSTTEAAKAWEGWGTSLKPAHEPIVVARKPLEGTVAGNVLRYGTGALNIDASRVEYKSESDKASAIPQGRATARVGALAGKAQKWESATTSATEPSITAPMTGTSATSTTPAFAESATGTARTEFTPKQSDAGRFPPNVLLDESQAAGLDEQSGVLVSGVGAVKRASSGDREGNRGAAFGRESRGEGTPMLSYGDSGGASRFFPTFRYEAKAPSSERPEVDGVQHSTVKPLDLMRWLVRLVTRPGGHVLDPFAGSGTTGEAALLEGMEVTLIELEADHLPLILQRVRKPLQPAMFGI